MNLKLENWKSVLEDKSTGFAIIGKNNTGKTYQMSEFYTILQNKSLGEYEYRYDTVLYISKEMITGEIKKLSQFKSENTFNLEGEKKFNYKEDLYEDEEISLLIANYLEKNSDVYNDILFDFFNVKLKYEAEENEILILTNEESKELETIISNGKISEVRLSSSGYISLVRLMVLLEVFLTEDTTYILLDEPDAFLDTDNRKLFLQALEEVKKMKNSSAKFIFSTHNPETLFALPDGYKIIQLLEKKTYKEYFSQDFFTKEKLEEKLFNRHKDYFKLSLNMKVLINEYHRHLIAPQKESPIQGDSLKILDKDGNVEKTIDKQCLSIKEKIIFNSIKNLYMQGDLDV